MKYADKELQNQIEKGLLNHESEDAGAYQRVFNVLKKEPDFHVSLPFADRIIALVDKKEERRDLWWLAVGIFLTVIALMVSLALTSTQWNAGVFTFVAHHSALVVFGIAFVLLLHLVDKKIINKSIEIK